MDKHWLEEDLINQTSLNKIKKNNDTSLYVCWLYYENGQYYVTDLGVKLIAKINQKKLYKIRTLLNSKSTVANATSATGIKFVRVFLKQYLYSSMVNFGPERVSLLIISFVSLAIFNLLLNLNRRSRMCLC